MSKASLVSIIYCQPGARRFSGEPLEVALPLPETISPSRPLEPEELTPQFVSQYLRPTDIPLAFHRESRVEFTATRNYQEMATKLEALGGMLQYAFSDGLILNANQILFHEYSRQVPRHLLPMSVNVRTELRDGGRFHQVPSWQFEAELVIQSVLLGAARAARFARQAEEEMGPPLRILFCHDDSTHLERTAVSLEQIEISSGEWGPWRLSTALHEPHSGVHHGRARIELDADELGQLHGLSEKFHLDIEKKCLKFHSFEDQLQRLKNHVPDPHESGLSLHLSGHSQIQSSIQEVNDLWSTQGLKLKIFPSTHRIPKERIKPRIALTGDGSVRFTSTIQTDVNGSWEAHGLPQSMAYMLLNLQFGLGATTGFSNTQIAHTRRGLKRERDMKILRSLGFAALVFYDASSFALDLPLSDGTKAKSEKEVCESLFVRLGSLILKSEGWPVQTGSLVDLCSKNVTTLIEGFVKQVVSDIRGRDIAIYLPEGEFVLESYSRPVALFYHALLSDLAISTNGQCFSKARTKYFENFMNGRPSIEREDLAVRAAVDEQVSARMVYQPGVNERYILPTSSVPPHGTSLFNLLNQGFEISIDGKYIEEFSSSDFRPEFNLRENDISTQSVALGTAKLDWFELHPKFFFKGVEITGEQAQRLSREGMIEFQGKVYRVKPDEMPSMKRLTRFWATIQSHNAGLMKSKRRKTEETYFQLPRSQTLELLALRATGVKMNGGPKWNEICRFYDALNQERPPLQLPDTFKAKLQPYQSIGTQWIRDLYNLGLGGILADDMGLGKTVTTLAFLELLRLDEKLGPTLILVPTSLTYNWLSESARFTPQLPVQIFSSRDPEQTLDFVQKNSASVTICTYGLLQEHSELFQQVPWNIIVFDEAQNLKNITTKRTTAARKLQGAFRLCLTGTPLENHYGELYSLFDLIVPGSLGDLPDFRERFVNPPRVLREDIDELRLKTKPLLLRRTKAQVMHELPPKVEATIKLPFEEEQQKIYRDIASSYNEQVRQMIAKQGEAKSQLQMLTALLRLRQACSDPGSIPGIVYNSEPPKVTTLLEALQEITDTGESALVFTQFLTTFERIRSSLTKAKIKHFDMSGADSRLAREKKLQAFQEEKGGAVMLMTLKTGGVGLNLVKASYIFHIEPWWNPAVENQATDRAHRMGQTKRVQVYRYLIKDSVEEKIEILKDLKSQRFDALFSVDESDAGVNPGSSSLTQKDFEYLLS